MKFCQGIASMKLRKLLKVKAKRAQSIKSNQMIQSLVTPLCTHFKNRFWSKPNMTKDQCLRISTSTGSHGINWMSHNSGLHLSQKISSLKARGKARLCQAKMNQHRPLKIDCLKTWTSKLSPRWRLQTAHQYTLERIQWEVLKWDHLAKN